MIIKYIFLFILICFMTGFANLFLKLGANKSSWVTINFLPSINSYLIFSIILFLLGLIIYSYSLKFIPLYLAQSLLSFQYVVVIFIGKYYFNEEISNLDLLGIILIILGITIISANLKLK